MICHYLNTAMSIPCVDAFEVFDALADEQLTGRPEKTTCLECWWWIAFSWLTPTPKPEERR